MSAVSKALPRPCPTCGEISGGVFCPADGMPLEGAFSLGGDRYVLEELIGNGAMAIVFGGRHRTLSRPVAVKILRPEVAENPDQQQRFLREARSASQLNHENIVGVLDFGWDDDLGVTYMVMERLFGQTLAEQIGGSGRMAWREAMPLLVQICRAVGTAHGLGIVHRDLTSRNVILVQGAGRRIVKLCDFGLSRQAGGGRATHNGVWIGSPAYMAPEQHDHDSVVESSSDIYSIGVLAYEMLTGHLPIEGLADGVSAIEVVAAKLAEEPRRLAVRFPELGLPEDLDALILRCLDREPARRPTAAELERALVRIDARATTAGAPLVGSAASSPAIFPSLDDGEPSMIGSYRVVRSLGSGGTGRVYLGEHPVIGTKVAIKVLLPEIAGSRETVERFIQEARTSSQIESPHIPRYYDFGRTAGGLPYAVMEYFEGETLAERIEKHGALSVAESADILGQVAGALTLAHQAGLVHRDLKPENIFLVAADPKAMRAGGEHSAPGIALPVAESGAIGGSAFNVKVLDFGIAKTFGKESGTRTQQGFFLGTPFYCAPEQVFGAEVDPRADVYGLGATAFEMLTGLPPFVGEISEVLEAKTSREAPLLRTQRADVSELVEATVACMLARDPAARAPSMTWVQEQVARWLRPASPALLHEQVASGDDHRGRISGRLARSSSPAPASGGRAGSSPALELELAARERSSPSILVAGAASARRGSEPSSARERSSPSIPVRGASPARWGSEAGSSPSLQLPLRPSSGALAAAVTNPGFSGFSEEEPLLIESTRPRRGDDQDFDALETVALLPGERAGVHAPPPAVRPLWRRPLPLALAAAAAVAFVAIAYLGTSGSASVSHHEPAISPIADPAAARPIGAAGATAVPASIAGDVPGAAGDPSLRAGDPPPSPQAGDPQGGPAAALPDPPESSEEGDRGDRTGRSDKLDKEERRDRRDRRGRRDRRDRTSQETPRPEKDPEPPRDVKFVDPFEK